MELLKNKNVIITGATRGIGKGIAILFANHGANIAFTYRSSDKEAKLLKDELETISGNKIFAFKSDAADFNMAQKLVKDISQSFESIDVLVNNAGITKDNLLMRMNEDDFDNVMKVNVNSVFNLTKSVLRPMLKQRSGSIINMSSVVGVRGNAGQSNYSASKAAIIGFTKSIALELGSRNIRCNAIAPGFIETDMTSQGDGKLLESWIESIPLKRAGSIDDVANLCSYLASDEASYITGQIIKVDGGLVT